MSRRAARKQKKYKQDSSSRNDYSTSPRRRRELSQQDQMSKLRQIYHQGYKIRIFYVTKIGWVNLVKLLEYLKTNAVNKKQYEAALAILSIDQLEIQQRVIRATFGATKYCSAFLKGQQCTLNMCLFLHSYGKQELVVNKDQQLVKNIFDSQQKLVQQVFIKNIKKIVKMKQQRKSLLPGISEVINKLLTEGKIRQDEVVNAKEQTADQQAIRMITNLYVFRIGQYCHSRLWFASKSQNHLDETQRLRNYLMEQICAKH